MRTKSIELVACGYFSAASAAAADDAETNG